MMPSTRTNSRPVSMVIHLLRCTSRSPIGNCLAMVTLMVPSSVLLSPPLGAIACGVDCRPSSLRGRARRSRSPVRRRRPCGPAMLRGGSSRRSVVLAALSGPLVFSARRMVSVSPTRRAATFCAQRHRRLPGLEDGAAGAVVARGICCSGRGRGRELAAVVPPEVRGAAAQQQCKGARPRPRNFMMRCCVQRLVAHVLRASRRSPRSSSN